MTQEESVLYHQYLNLTAEQKNYINERIINETGYTVFTTIPFTTYEWLNSNEITAKHLEKIKDKSYLNTKNKGIYCKPNPSYQFYQVSAAFSFACSTIFMLFFYGLYHFFLKPFIDPQSGSIIKTILTCLGSIILVGAIGILMVLYTPLSLLMITPITSFFYLIAILIGSQKKWLDKIRNSLGLLFSIGITNILAITVLWYTSLPIVLLLPSSVVVYSVVSFTWEVLFKYFFYPKRISVQERENKITVVGMWFVALPLMILAILLLLKILPVIWIWKFLPLGGPIIGVVLQFFMPIILAILGVMGIQHYYTRRYTHLTQAEIRFLVEDKINTTYEENMQQVNAVKVIKLIETIQQKIKISKTYKEKQKWIQLLGELLDNHILLPYIFTIDKERYICINDTPQVLNFSQNLNTIKYNVEQEREKFIETQTKNVKNFFILSILKFLQAEKNKYLENEKHYNQLITYYLSDKQKISEVLQAEVLKWKKRKINKVQFLKHIENEANLPHFTKQLNLDPFASHTILLKNSRLSKESINYKNNNSIPLPKNKLKLVITESADTESTNQSAKPLKNVSLSNSLFQSNSILPRTNTVSNSTAKGSSQPIPPFNQSNLVIPLVPSPSFNGSNQSSNSLFQRKLSNRFRLTPIIEENNNFTPTKETSRPSDKKNLKEKGNNSNFIQLSSLTKNPNKENTVEKLATYIPFNSVNQ